MPSNPFKKSYFRKRIFPRDAFCFHKKNIYMNSPYHPLVRGRTVIMDWWSGRSISFYMSRRAELRSSHSRPKTSCAVSNERWRNLADFYRWRLLWFKKECTFTINRNFLGKNVGTMFLENKLLYKSHDHTYYVIIRIRSFSDSFRPSHFHMMLSTEGTGYNI